MKIALEPIAIVLAVGFALTTGAAKPKSRQPRIGYVYPAGGQRGTSFSAMVGGQYMQGATNVFVSGEGVTVDIVRYSVKYEPRRLRNMFNNRENTQAMLEGKEGKELKKIERRLAKIERQLSLLEVPDGVDPFDKEEVVKLYKIKGKEQFNPQISERLRIKVTIDRNAPPGERELRVNTSLGLSNPIYFQVGSLKEIGEIEPNDDHMAPRLQVAPVPCVINGQIRPGDIDHFRFKARKSQSIIVDVGARRIIPYLADAVPGWFQAVVAIYDENGNEVAYQDDYKFNPDPVLFFEVPRAGTYTLSIRDSIYRGREDFVYRIAVGELPFITSIFPLGAQQGQAVDIALTGKNLPKRRLTGKLPDEEAEVRHISVRKGGYRSNQMPFAVGEIPEIFEVEPNNSPDEAQPVETPLLVNGRIQQPGDRDVFSFNGKKGDTVSIEVIARRLNSPLDSMVSLSGPGLGKPMRNDDYVNKSKTHLHLGAGLVTHHADSFLLKKLPATGTYYVEIGDTQSKGGKDHGYRLRISPAKPDFELRMEPSGLNIAPGGKAKFTVHVVRKEGFAGKIALYAVKLPPGYAMSSAVIPADSDTTRFTITASREITDKFVNLQISGMGLIDGNKVSRPVTPVDDQMQAFLYRHLVPAQELILVPASAPSP